MRAFLMAALLALGAIAQILSQPLDHHAALAGIAATGTTPERRDELFTWLANAPFARLAPDLARRIVQHPYESGIHWRTATPWLDAQLPEYRRVAATYEVLWETHTRLPRDGTVTSTLLDLLADTELGAFRERIVHLVLAVPPPLDDGTTKASAITRLEHLARVDPSPRFRAVVVQALCNELPPACFADLAIDIVRTQRTAEEQASLLLATDICRHVEGFPADVRRRHLHFAFDLLQRCPPPSPVSWYQNGLLVHVAQLLRLVPANAHRQLTDANAAWETLPKKVWAWRDRHDVRAPRPAMPADTVWPIVDWRTQLACRLRGTATLTCRSSWHHLDALALATRDRLELTAIDLAPLLPATPVAIGAKWTVPGSQLTEFATRLVGTTWNTTDATPATWWSWNGELVQDHAIDAQGDVDVVCERRADAVGLAIRGTLVVGEKACIGNRYGPNELRATTTCRLQAWLPLDADGAIRTFELQHDFDSSGTYGIGGSSESFTMRGACASDGPFQPTPDEQRELATAIATLGDPKSLPPDGAEATTRLRRLGSPWVAERLVETIGANRDPGTRQRLLAALRQLR